MVDHIRIDIYLFLYIVVYFNVYTVYIYIMFKSKWHLKMTKQYFMSIASIAI